MSIKQNMDLPGLGGSSRNVTSLFEATVQNAVHNSGSASLLIDSAAEVKPRPGSTPDVTSGKAPSLSSRHRDKSRKRKTKRLDGFIVLLLLLLGLGLAFIAWLTFALLSPSPLLPPAP